LSVFIALLLIVAVNQVFRATSDTIGAGQALGSAVRDYRAVQHVFYGDLSSAVMPYAAGGSTLEDAPFFVVRSERLTMFRSRRDDLVRPSQAARPHDAERRRAAVRSPLARRSRGADARRISPAEERGELLRRRLGAGPVRSAARDRDRHGRQRSGRPDRGPLR